MIRKISILGLLVAGAFTSTAFSKPEVQCIQNKKEAFNLAYLHGLDSEKPGSLELENRLILKSLSRKLGFRLAILRSKELCKGRLCWPQTNQKVFKKIYTDIRSSLSNCIDSNKKTLVLGFSNGGYFVNKMAQMCSPHFSAFAASGAAGDVRFFKKTNSATKPCPSLTLIMGTKDISLKKAKEFQKQWQHANVALNFKTFQGGHRIDRESLKHWLLGHKTK